MKTFIIALSIILSVGIVSCKKQEDVTINKNEENGNFLPMEVGNYWVYDVSWIDTLGNVDFLYWDSTYVVGDTSINGNVYSIYNSSSSAFYVQYLRDSASYIVDESGERFFNSNNFTEKLFEDAFINVNGDTTIYTYRQMRKPNSQTICMAGSFNALDAEMTKLLPFVNRESKAHAYYAPKVGLIIREDFPLFSGKRKVYNLHHYSVK